HAAPGFEIDGGNEAHEGRKSTGLVQGQKVLEQTRSRRGRALGVELRSVEIAPWPAGAEGRPVAGARDRGLPQFQSVAVHVVGVISVRQSREERAGPPYGE